MHEGQPIRVLFPYPEARLPVLRKDGSTDLVAWGRRRDQAGQLPQGGWARLDSVKAGRWDRWFPKSVKIPAFAFMEKGPDGCNEWYDLPKHKLLHGLLAHEPGAELRVYLITIDVPRETSAHGRWPHVLVRF